MLLTLTLRHNRRMSLADSRAALTKAWGKMQAGNPWVRILAEWGIVGHVRALEITWGYDNGWHPHLHVLIFTDSVLDSVQVAQLESRLKDRWLSKLKAQGYDATREHGLDLRAGNEYVSQYLAKFGHEPKVGRGGMDGVGSWTVAHEITKAPVKQGKGDNLTPLGLLQLSLEGHKLAVKGRHVKLSRAEKEAIKLGKRASALWIEYHNAMKGQRQLVWSKGLKQRLGIGEVSDQEAAEQVIDPATSEPLEWETLIAFLPDEWRLWVRRLTARQRGKLLEIAAEYGVDAQPKIAKYLEDVLHQLESDEHEQALSVYGSQIESDTQNSSVKSLQIESEKLPKDESRRSSVQSGQIAPCANDSQMDAVSVENRQIAAEPSRAGWGVSSWIQGVSTDQPGADQPGQSERLPNLEPSRAERLHPDQPPTLEPGQAAPTSISKATPQPTQTADGTTARIVGSQGQSRRDCAEGGTLDGTPRQEAIKPSAERPKGGFADMPSGERIPQNHQAKLMEAEPGKPRDLRAEYLLRIMRDNAVKRDSIVTDSNQSLDKLPNDSLLCGHDKLPNEDDMAKRTSKPNSNKDFWRGTTIDTHGSNGQPVRISIRGFGDAPPNTDIFASWLANVKSFAFSRYANPVGDEWLITVRREKRANGSFWYAFKTYEGKTYKVYIGADDAINLPNLKRSVEAMKHKITERTS